MKLVPIFGLALAFALGAGIAVADDQRLDEAWKDALEEKEGLLTEKQEAAMNVLAFQSAATRVCDGFEIDPAKFETAFAAAVDPGSLEVTPEDRLHRDNAILVNFGIAVGLFIAEGKAAPEGFCANAEEARKDTTLPVVWE